LAPLSTANIGLRILVEVASIYNERDKPEALIAAGSLALGREPCKSYPGWGVVTPWQGSAQSAQEAVFTTYDEVGKAGWIVGRISQEHGILVWEGENFGMRELHVGEKLLLWPNHACIAGAGFGWYLVVDSDSVNADEIVDVWVRWRGW
jgi:D-serine deaminase-like pyridoxal phosphate-dependent protein